MRLAAKELLVSQPAVSASITALAASVGVPLVERDGRGLRLTAAGHTVAGYARQILGLMAEAKDAANALAGPATGHLRLAAVTTPGEALLPRWLRSFRSTYPGVEIKLEIGNRERLWTMLAHREVDLGIGGRPPVGEQGLATIARRRHELVLVAAPDLTPRPKPEARAERPGSQRSFEEVSEHDLANRTWLVREAGSNIRSTTEELLADLGIDPPLLTLGSNGSIREAAAIGLGVAMLSRDTVERDLSEGNLVEWRCGPLPLRRHWHFGVRAGEVLPGPTQLFVGHVLKIDQMANDAPMQQATYRP